MDDRDGADDVAGALVGRWPLPASAVSEDVRDRLLAAYADPRRGYHDVRHLAEVLDRLDELERAGERFDRRVVTLAAWFHDAVYDGAPDDEERSALLAEETLPEAGVPAADVAAVARLVRMTATHEPAADDPDACALSDADLGVLAAGPERYATYLADVRRDFAHVSDDDFRAGRRAVLGALDAQPTLFRTRTARSRWEAPARANLARELADLSP